jgi:dTDP-4-amino-4,6-dideoxygalactose transaminase
MTVPPVSSADSRPVPFLDLKRQHESIRTEIEAAVGRVFASQRFILGPEGEALESECAAAIGAPSAVAVASGTDALLLIWRAIGLRPGDEVVTSPFSFFASAGSVANAGGRPVFADIDPVTFNLDPAAAAAAIGGRTRAVCAVHLFGQAADLGGLRAVLAGRGVALVEDACQAIGASLDGTQVGALGEAAAFSFFPTKNLGGAGDGGLVTARDAEIARTVRLLRHHGQTSAYEHALIGTNSRLDEIQAAVLRVKLRHLAAWTEARRARARQLAERLSAAPLRVRREGGRLDGADLSLPAEVAGRVHAWNQFTIRARDRDGLRRHLLESGIGCAVYYPLPLHLQPCFAFLGGRAGQFPAAEEACREVLSLPVFPELTDAELERVTAAIAAFYARGGGRT